MAESAFLWVHGLRFAYPECVVLDNLSLAWPPGLALVRGDESTGKTTLTATQDLKASGLNVEATAQMGAKLAGNATAELSASGQTTVKGAIVMIN